MTGMQLKTAIALTVWSAALFLVLSVPLAWSLDLPEPLGYVTDHAGIISPDTKSGMEEKLNTLDRTSSNQILVLTIPTLEDQALEDFGTKVFKAWNTGAGKLDNGVILIVAEKEGKIRIEAGRALKEKMTDLIAGRITDTVMAPKFKRGNYEAAILEGIDAIILVMKGDYETPGAGDSGGRNFIMYIAENSGTLMIYAIVLMLAISLFSELFNSILGDKFLTGRVKLSKLTFSALVGTVCGPVAGYLMIGKKSPAAWLFYLLSGALLGILGKKMNISKARVSSSTGGSGSSGSGGGFSGGGGSSGGGGASGDY